MASRIGIAALAAVLALAACAKGSTPKPEPKTLPGHSVLIGPEGPAFYTAPQPPAAATPGDLIWARTLQAPAGIDGYAIMYWSSKVDGQLVAVSGVLFEPSQPSNTPRPIVAWAHGTLGLADQCAMSRESFTGNSDTAAIVAQTVKLGMIFVGSDYEGLGPPGAHPFMVNESSARNVLDSIRAAQRFAGKDSDAVILGRSQGGAATLVAAELQPQYAPKLKLRGAVAISVPSGMDKLDGQLSGGPYFGYVLMTAYGYMNAYPNLAGEESKLTDAGRAALRAIPDECIDKILSQYAGEQEAKYGLAEVLGAPQFREVLVRNDPRRLAPAVPVLIVHGESDDTIPVANAREMVKALCGKGAPVTAIFYGDRGHIDVLTAAATEILEFIADRLAGQTSSANCAGVSAGQP